jgi:hypothetical protein
VDLVYVVRPGEHNNELRYSLRSVAQHLPHDRVWIVGYAPTWLRSVETLHRIQDASKWENSTGNLLTACDHPGISEQFVYMNDDFYVMEPLDKVPTLHRGPVTEVLASYTARYQSAYTEGMERTARLLDRWGYDEPLSYELHAPLVVNKSTMLDVLHRAAAEREPITALHKRTLYGNVALLEGERTEDVKVSHGHPATLPSGPFLSSAPRTFRSSMKRLLARRFPTRSPYERR